ACADADDAWALQFLNGVLSAGEQRAVRDAQPVVAPQHGLLVQRVEHVGRKLEADAANERERLRNAEIEIVEIRQAELIEAGDENALAAESVARVEHAAIRDDVTLASRECHAEGNLIRELIDAVECRGPA